jgi:hypothetical protein
VETWNENTDVLKSDIYRQSVGNEVRIEGDFGSFLVQMACRIRQRWRLAGVNLIWIRICLNVFVYSFGTEPRWAREDAGLTSSQASCSEITVSILRALKLFYVEISLNIHISFINPPNSCLEEAPKYSRATPRTLLRAIYLLLQQNKR